jgi:hypothetical protein
MESVLSLSKDNVRRLFEYRPESGELVWRERPEEDFSSLHRSRIWNVRYAGKVAGYLTALGYREASVFGRYYKVHRIVWLYVNGEWPPSFIDHINHDRSDNRIENLRVASKAENGRNQTLRSSNTSGFMGVGWHKSSGKWRARIFANGRDTSLGTYHSFDEAKAARLAAMELYGFHDNHGF